MAMNAEQMVAFFGRRTISVRGGLEIALAKDDYQLAAFNCRQLVKCHLMQALITWRLGRDPSTFVRDAVHACDHGWAVMSRIGGDQARQSDAPFEIASLLAFLVNENRPAPCTDGLHCERLLDAVLSGSLSGTWDADCWANGVTQLRAVGSPLAIATYLCYERLVSCRPDEVATLVNEGTQLFTQRRKDEYYSGGVQTEGGGPDNAFTVDYRLASLAKAKGHASDGIHTWRWM